MGAAAAQFANQQNKTQAILFIDGHSKTIMLIAFAGIGAIALVSSLIGHFNLSV